MKRPPDPRDRAIRFTAPTARCPATDGPPHRQGAIARRNTRDRAGTCEPERIAGNAERLEARGGRLLRSAVIRGSILAPDLRPGGAFNAIGAVVLEPFGGSGSA